ncbi:hypothetical protein BGW37DRAFT_495790 [Umbelopsis sp. PMI_123]|nr:hypothetical protein BGW37DRAFT_495790 [Umbelopsis sp. PMI_123]
MDTTTVISKGVDSIERSSYPGHSSSYNYIQSSVRQSSDIRQDTEFARLLDRVEKEYNENRLENASECIQQAPRVFQSAFDLQLWNLKIYIQLDKIEQAVALFISLHAENMQNRPFLQFLLDLVNITEDIPIDEHALALLSHLPPLYQRSVLDYAIDYYINRDHTHQASYLMVYYMKRFGRLESEYLIRAVDLAAESALSTNCHQSQSLLVKDIIPLLFKHKLELVSGDVRRIRIDDKPMTIVMGKDYFLQLLRAGQSFYANELDWQGISYITTQMLNLCRFPIPADGPMENFLSEMAGNREKMLAIWDGPATPKEVKAAYIMEYESAAVMAKLLQLSMEYYHHICSSDDANEEKACLIPICALRSMPPSQPSSDFEKQEDTTVTNSNGKRVRNPKVDESQTNFSMLSTSEASQPQLKRYRETKDDTTTVSKDVDDALFILNSASLCFRYLTETSNRAIGLSADVDTINWDTFMRQYQLSFTLFNAMLLLRSDLSLVHPNEMGNLSTALKLNQELCDRIEAQRRKEKLGNDKESLVHEVPFMFAFRVLYTISIIYLLVGSIHQSTMEVAIILSVFPLSRGLTEEDFEIDEVECHRAIQKFQGREFGMMRMTQQGFVTRCIKHLVIGLEVETEPKGGMSSIDAAMRWDEKAGNIMVLMQFGWPYWKHKTKYWSGIVQHIKEKKILKNKTFLEHIHVTEILSQLLWLQETDNVTLDVIPTGMVMSGETFDQSATAPNSPRQPNMVLENVGSPSSSSSTLPTLSSLPLLRYNKVPPQAPKVYQPPSINTILPSMSMSPTWYSASYQKGANAQWMSPSFYYSRPATSVLLPSRPGIEPQRAQWHQPSTSKDMVTRYLKYKIQRLSPKATPQKMRHVLQRFLKSMIARNDKAA